MESPYKGKTGLKRLWNAFGYSLAGFRAAYKHEDAFRQEVEGMQAVAAVNLKLTARLSPGVKPVKVYSTVPMISDISAKAVNGQGVTAGLGSLDGKQGQKVLIETS